MIKDDKARRNLFTRFLDKVEIVGNKLPHPAMLFLILAALVTILSMIAHYFDYTAIHPVNDKTIHPKNLLSGDGIRWIYTSL
jgi:aminobenzoyl-glutamate transport protein